ncbi:MAG: hypothetical protein LBU88_05970 [Treponema sp.]|nr:hypothetical protein [Treponema sp.]
MLILCASAQAHATFTPDVDILNRNAPIFPHMLFTETITNSRRVEASRPYWVNTREEQTAIERRTSYQISMLLNYDILAYYGHPGSRNMGILGRHTIEEIDQMLTELAKVYEATGGKKIKKAFYLIYGTVWPEGEIGIMRDSMLMPYIEYGMKNDILVFVDHQIGKYHPIEPAHGRQSALHQILPYLRYPNVHLALDPEWRTTRPMQVLGQVTADELNRAQQIMENYMIANNIPGERMLVIHQFNSIMVRNASQVRTDFNRVRFIHCMDGIGDPEMKRGTYDFVAQFNNMPLKGFKLFYNLGIPGAGFDNPIMSPQDVYELNPRPLIIMYQ